MHGQSLYINSQRHRAEPHQLLVTPSVPMFETETNVGRFVKRRTERRGRGQTPDGGSKTEAQQPGAIANRSATIHISILVIPGVIGTSVRCMPDRAQNDKLRRTLSSLVMAIGAVIVLVQWISTMLKPHGDFSRHWEFGRRFVHGEFLYNGGLDIPYPPFFAMAYAPLSFLPLRVAKPILFLFGFGALFLIFRILNRLTDRALVIRRGD